MASWYNFSNDASKIPIPYRYQYTVPEPHANYCRCQQCKENKLGQARLTVLILKTLSNPLWMRWSSDDPFLTLFEICLVNKQQYKVIAC